MERHHEGALQAALDQLYLEGVVSIRWDLIYYWYRADRITKRVYADIQERWSDLWRSRNPDLVKTNHVAPDLRLLNLNSHMSLMRESLPGKQEVWTDLKDWTT